MKKICCTGTLKGSALMWAIGIIAVLAVVIMTSITVSMFYTASASKQTGENQAYYSAKSGIRTVIPLICDGVEYDSAMGSFNPLLGEPPVNAKIDLGTIPFVSPDSDVSMGNNTAEFVMRDDVNGILTVTCEIENVGTKSVSAVLCKEGINPSYNFGLVARELYVNSGSLTISSGTRLFLNDYMTSALVGLIEPANPPDVLVPDRIASETEYTPYEVSAVPTYKVVMNMPGAGETKIKNDMSLESGIQYGLTKKNDNFTLTLASGDDKKYFITCKKNMNGSVSFVTDDITKPADVYIFINSGYTLNINQLPQNIRLFVACSKDGGNSKKDSVLNLNGVQLINGVVEADKIIISGGTGTVLNYSEPDTSIMYVDDGTTPSPTKYKWKFVKYTESGE